MCIYQTCCNFVVLSILENVKLWSVQPNFNWFLKERTLIKKSTILNIVSIRNLNFLSKAIPLSPEILIGREGRWYCISFWKFWDGSFLPSKRLLVYCTFGRVEMIQLVSWRGELMNNKICLWKGFRDTNISDFFCETEINIFIWIFTT